VRAAATTAIVTLEWSKFCGWVGLMSLSVVTRAETWKYLADPDAARLLARLVREMGALAARLGIGLSDRAVLPAASLCAGSEDQAVASLMQLGAEYRTRVPQHRMSTLQDLEGGRALEIEETLGYAVRDAARLNLALPLLEGFYRLARGIDQTRRLS
jgi:ketopantoate reductase